MASGPSLLGLSNMPYLRKEENTYYLTIRIYYVMIVIIEEVRIMRKKLTISIDEGVYRELKRIPRGFSVSEFVSFMLKVMVREAKGSFRTQEDFEKWVNSDPELKKVREGI